MGRPQFETVVAQAPRESLVFANHDKAISHPNTGEYDWFEIYAPTGYIGQITNLYLSVPAVSGATTGYHALEFGYPQIVRAYGEGAYNSNLQFKGNEFINETLSIPANTDQALNHMIFDDKQPFFIGYRNFTNSINNGTLTRQFYYILKQVAL